MVAHHPSQINQKSSFLLPKKIKCHIQLLKHLLDKTFLSQHFLVANLMLKMAKGLMKTRYPKHLDLVPIRQVLFRLVRQLRLHHLVHTKLEFDVPTKVGARYTSHACCRPNQSIAVLIQVVRFLLAHFEPHLRLPLQVVLLSQTTVSKVLAQQWCRNASSAQPHEYMVVFQKQLDPSLLILQPRQLEQQSDPFHQTQCQCHP